MNASLDSLTDSYVMDGQTYTADPVTKGAIETNWKTAERND